MSAMNDPAAWSAELPAANGFSTARSLSRMYAACLGEVDGVRLMSAEAVAAATTPQAEGTDRVLGVESRFGLGFQPSYPLRPFAGPGSFGRFARDHLRVRGQPDAPRAAWSTRARRR